MRLVLTLLVVWLPFAATAQDVVTSADPDVVAEVVKGTPEQPYSSSEIALEQFRWNARPLIIFADAEADPVFRRQMELLRARPEVLADRDVVVIVDTDPSARSELRTALRPRGFMLVIIGKDGQVELRKPSPWNVREISRSIDKMPLRQQEIREDLMRQ